MLPDRLRRRARLEVTPLEPRFLCSAEPILDTRPFPFRAVAKLVSWFDVNRNGIEDGGEVYQATAAMIGPRSALTSAHIVYDVGLGGFATKVTIQPGATGGRAPFGTFRATNFVITNLYRQHEGAGNDVAVLNFAVNIGRRTGWFRYLGYKSSALTRAQLHNIGYPGDTQTGEQQFSSSGFPIKLTQSEIRYRTSSILVEHGSSGSPLFRQFPASSQRVIVGLHSRRINHGAVGVSTRITPRLVRFIHHAQQQRLRGGLIDLSNGRLTSHPGRIIVSQAASNAAFMQLTSAPFTLF
jgi:V8-like Glu-specific endopeptidase